MNTTTVEVPEMQIIQFIPICTMVWHGSTLISNMNNLFTIDATDQQIIDWYLADLRKKNRFNLPLLNPSVVRGQTMVFIGQNLTGYGISSNGSIDSVTQYIQPLTLEVSNPKDEEPS